MYMKHMEQSIRENVKYIVIKQKKLEINEQRDNDR